MIGSRMRLAALAAAAVALQPIAAQAQQACITEDEFSAVAIYSVPSLLQGMRLKCAGELASTGFLARRGDELAARYTRLQPAVWPRAKSGLLKYGACWSKSGKLDVSTVASLPDDAVRPLVDALIVQEASARISTSQCGRIERAMEAAALIDPEIAGTVIGAAAGLLAPENTPICERRVL